MWTAPPDICDTGWKEHGRVLYRNLSYAESRLQSSCSLLRAKEFRFYQQLKTGPAITGYPRTSFKSDASFNSLYQKSAEICSTRLQFAAPGSFIFFTDQPIHRARWSAGRDDKGPIHPAHGPLPHRTGPTTEGPRGGGGKGPLPRKPLFSSCQVYEFQAARKILKDAENLIIWFTLKCEPQYILNSVRLSSFLSLAKFLWEFIQTDLFGSFPPTQAEAACTSTSTRRFYYKYIKSAFWIASVSTFPTAGSCSGTLLAAGLAFLEGTERGRISKSSDTELM